MSIVEHQSGAVVNSVSSSLRYRKLVRRIDDLPTLPSAALDAIGALQSGEADTNQICESLEKDPVLVARCLRVVNSAAYAIREPVTTIRKALVYLGSESVLNIVNTTSVMDAFQSVNRECDLRWFWEHSLACAVLTRRAAKTVGYAQAELGYLAGLLHDIGLLPTLIWAREEWENAKDYAVQGGASLADAERDLLGYTHEHLGGLALEKWSINDEIVNVARHHHHPSSADATSRKLTHLVSVGDLCARASGLDIDLKEDSIGFDLSRRTIQSRLQVVNSSFTSGKCDAFIAELQNGADELKTTVSALFA